jgi:hypothetical protein
MSSGSSQGRWGLAPAALVGSAVLAGCSLLPGAGSGATPVSPSSAPTVAATAAASPSSTAAPPDGPVAPSISISDFPRATPSPTTTATPKGNERGLAVGQTRIRGRASSASWDIAIPEFSGPAVADEANRRVRAAANDLIAQIRREAKDDGGVKRTLTGTGTVGTNDGRTVQVTITFTDYLAGTARPASFVTTTVVDIRRARPVLLTQVLQNPPEGLRFLRAEVTKVAKTKREAVDPAGLAPKVANWANWQSSPAGLTFSFPEYQLGGAGIRSYTVPWDRARLVLSAYGERLLAPA